MNKAKTFSIIAITLLILQIISPNLALGSVSQAAKGNDDTKIDIAYQANDGDSLIWDVMINAAGESNDGTKTTLELGKGQSHQTIDGSRDASVEKTATGYVIETPVGNGTYKITVTTKIIEGSQTEFQLQAEMAVDGGTYQAEERVVVEGKDESEPQEQKKPLTSSEVQKKNEKGDKKDPTKEAVEEEQVQDANEVVGVTHPPFAKTMAPIALQGENPGSNWPAPGSLNLNKVATATSNYNEWEIELTVEGKNLKTSSDIVLVFDKSGSMREGQRLPKAKAAAKAFVNNLLIEGSSTRIALVEFSSSASKTVDFTGYANKQELINKINNISATGGTHIHAGLHQADILLNGSTADMKTIVLLSDGEPTYSFKAGNAANYSGWSAHANPNNTHNFILSNFNYNNTLGSGSSYTYSSGQQYGLGQQTCVPGSFPWSSPVCTYEFNVKDNGIPTISEAKHIMDKGVGIYSVGLEVGNNNNAKYVLQNSQNKGYYLGGSDDLQPIFEEIAASLAYAATSAVVIDPLGDMFDLVKDGSYGGGHYSVSHGTVTFDDATETFSWNIGNVQENEIYTLKYKVTLDCGKNPHAGVEYPTNKTTTLNYKNHAGAASSKDFPIPEVSTDKGNITKKGYRVNVDGDPIDSDGNVVSSPAEAEQFYSELFGENLVMNQSYDVPANDVPEYVLHVGENPTTVQLSTNVCETVWFGYVKESELPAGDVIAKYVDEDGNEIENTETFTGNIGDPYTTIQKDIPGYEFVKMDDDSAPVTGTFTKDEQTVIYIYKQLKGTIKVVKVDENNEEITLEGAVFHVKDKDGKTVATLTTNKDGEATTDALPIGDYSLEEVTAPVGYELSTGQNLSVTVVADKESAITVTNKQLKGSITLIKVNKEGTVLEGAEFALQDMDGSEVATGTTDAEGKIVFGDLTIGEYKLVETKAPEGYRLLTKPIKVEVKATDLHIEKTVKNSPQGWDIPNTGGIGTLGFYSVGLLLMAGASWFVIRRRRV